jgi:hypothetical protein
VFKAGTAHARRPGLAACGEPIVADEAVAERGLGGLDRAGLGDRHAACGCGAHFVASARVSEIVALSTIPIAPDVGSAVPEAAVVVALTRFSSTVPSLYKLAQGWLDCRGIIGADVGD